MAACRWATRASRWTVTRTSRLGRGSSKTVFSNQRWPASCGLMVYASTSSLPLIRWGLRTLSMVILPKGWWFC